MIIKVLLSFSLGLLFTTSELFAQWNFDSTVNTQITSGTNRNNSNPSIAADGTGGYYLVWIQRNYSGVYGSDIYAQHIDKGGKKLWADTGIVICNAPLNQYWPKIIPDNSGGAILVWQDERSGFSNVDIYAQRINSSGNILWAANGIPVANSIINEVEPEIICDGNGGAIIAFWRQTNGTGDIYAQRVNASGQPVWVANGVPVSTAANKQQIPKMASDGNGGAIITWWDFRNSPTNNVPDIYAQRINPNGTNAWTNNGIPICVQPSDQSETQIASAPGGGAYFIWRDGRASVENTFITDIYGQKVASDGSVLWQTNGIPVCTAINHQLSPNLIVNEDGGITVAWCDLTSTLLQSLFVQKVNQLGVLLWGPTGVLVTTSAGVTGGAGPAPFLVGDGNNGLYVMWQDGRTGTDKNIYAQHILPNGKNNWQLNGIPVCTAPQDQILSYDQGQIMNGAAVSDNNGGVVLAWQDLRNASASEQDIYAAWLTDSLSSPVVLNVAGKCQSDANTKGKLANPPSNASIVITQDGTPVNYSPADSSFPYFTKQVTATGTHTVVVRYSNFTGAKQKDSSYSVSAVLMPTVLIAGDTVVTAGTPVLLTSVTSNAGTQPVYQWQEMASGAWQNISGATGSTMLYTPLQTGNKVRLLFIGSGTCVSKDTIISQALRFTVNNSAVPNYRLKYYPNPAHNTLTLDSLSGEWETLNMFASDGKQIIVSKNISGLNKTAVNIQVLADTVYIVVLRKKNGETYFFKILKQ